MTNQEPQNFAIGPEEIEQIIRLESIFMPVARRGRDELYHRNLSTGAVDKSAKFVHYTSAEAALSIIRNKCLWMRNATCMSDYSEVQHGFRIINDLFKPADFELVLDAIMPGITKEAIALFKQHWQGNIQTDTYITSISEHLPREDAHGRLSMWRAFGGAQGARVALVFNLPWNAGAARALNLLFSPVAYLNKEEVATVFEEVIASIKSNRDYLASQPREIVVSYFFLMLLAGVTCLKHEGFREEREWRAIYSPQRPSDLMKSSIEVISGVPQRVYKVPINEAAAPAVAGLEFSRIFDHLIIGPSPYPVPMREAFAEALVEAGVSQKTVRERISISGIPIRA